MRHSIMRAVALGMALPALLPLGGCGGREQAITASAVLGRYVVLGQSPEGGTVAFARAILEPGYGCPAIGGDSRIPMVLRDNPHGFSVSVCEAQIPFGQDLHLELGQGTLSLPRVKRNPSRITIMGDTGCEPANCPSGPAEPFRSMADIAAQQPADLLIHVGDYNYRGTSGQFTTRDPKTGRTSTTWAYDAGDGSSAAENCTQAPDSGFVSQNAPGSENPDAWEYWRDDFFAPAGGLLHSAPWVFARGNHELCSRAGPGWFYFLDPSSNLPGGGGRQLSCPPPQPDANPIVSVRIAPTYRLDLASLHLIVLDSANACDSFVTPPMQEFTQRYVDEAEKAGALAPDRETAWLVTHRPVWGVTDFDPAESTGCTPDNAFGCINQTLQHAFKQAFPSGLPTSLGLSIAGHIHRFQSLTFGDSSRPPQLVIGLSGVKLDGSPPVGAFETPVDGIQAAGLATGTEITAQNVGAFGFLEILYDPPEWKATLRDLDQSITIAECGSRLPAQGSICALSTSTSGN